MRSLRFIFIGIITFLFVTNAVFLRRTVSVLLCGVLSFNSTSCYSFLNKDEIVNAAVPPSTTVLASDDSSSSQKDEQKIAGLFDLPKIPIQIPGVPSGNSLEIAKTAVIKEIGEAVGVGSPLVLDQKTAYPDVSDQVKDFHPKQLTVTSAEDLQKPLPPGDYSLSVIAYCTQFSIHAPGQGLPYKLAPLMGKQAPAISALLSRGTLQGIAPATLNADSWRIQAGLPLKQWPSQDQALIHKLIPEYEKGLEGDYLQQIENTYNQYRLVPGIPSFNDLLRQSGAPGQTVLQLRQARQTLANQTISAERLPDMLYEPTGDGLPRVLPPAKDSSPSRWAEIRPGIFARFTVIEGHLGRNLFEFRVTPKAIAAINNSTTVATKGLDKNLQVSNAKEITETLALGPLPTLAIITGGGLIVYSIGRAAQALIIYFTPILLPDAREIARRLREEYPGWKDRLDACPCTTAEAAANPRFKNKYNSRTKRYHPGAEFDYRSTENAVTLYASPTIPGAPTLMPGQQCTYDAKGNLITGGAGAGTPDAYAPEVTLSGQGIFSDNSHTFWDVAPFEANGMTWQEYQQTWTPNNGNSCRINVVP